MGTRNNKRWQILQTALTAFSFGLVVTACGDDDEKGPTTNPINLDGSVGAIDSGIRDAGPTVEAGPVVDAGTPPVTGDCKGQNGCYSCAPTKTTTSAQLLNTCSTGCREFNNSARIPGFTGTLPPLQ